MPPTDETLHYRKTFAPGRVERRRTAGEAEAGDLRRDPVYVYTAPIVLAVNVALATRRPLLVRGPSGSGKSSLARSVAHVMGWRYYETVVTSRTQAGDLLWQVDLLRRLQDAREGSLGRGADRRDDELTPYIEPGPLWWAFAPETAAWRGERARSGLEEALADPNLNAEAATREGEPPRRAVVLIDEIDKADPDVPNNLLVPLGSFQFQVRETGFPVGTSPDRAPLVFITTNEEREMPAAFLRRSIELEIALPTRRRLLEIGAAHFAAMDPRQIETVAEALLGPADPERAEESVDVNPAEFVDTLRACDELEIRPGSEAWEALSRATVWKFGRQDPRSARGGGRR